MKIHLSLPAALVFAVLCAAQTSPGRFQANSPAVRGGVLPVEFTCDGESASPPLVWSNPPAGTRFFAVTMHHIPGPGDKHVYMVIYNIPGSATGISKNARDVGSWGVNTVNGRAAYTPPCSKGPGPKTYTLTVYALSSDVEFPGAGKATMDMLLAAIKNSTLATAAVKVTYSRGDAAEQSRDLQELQQTLSSLNLSNEQKQNVHSLLQQYGDKQRQLREDLLRQLRITLDPGQYAKIEESMKPPPPPPDRR